jgi:type IV pilus assembly protein PilV
MKSINKFQGFTLIEVLISLVILSISLLALAALIVTSTRNNSFGNHMTEATTLAQGKLEELRAVRWEAIPEGASTDPAPQIGSTGINYVRTWTVVTNGALKTVTITVRWRDKSNHSVRLNSVLSENG